MTVTYRENGKVYLDLRTPSLWQIKRDNEFQLLREERIRRNRIMFDLRNASEGIRKAAAMNGIWSGKFERIFESNDQHRNAVIAKIFNRNYPDGLKIFRGEAENVIDYTWKEIKEMR